MKNNEDIELMIFRLKEGLLSGEERRNAELFLRQHPEWQEAADLYDPLLKVPPYPAATFPGKDGLHKPTAPPEAPRRHYAIALRRLSIAASFLLAISIAAGLLLRGNNEEEPVIVAENRPAVLPADNNGNPANPDETGSLPESTPQQTIHTTRHASHFTRNTESTIAQDLQPDSEARSTATVTITDRLIVYLDDTPSQETDIPAIGTTDRLIAYMPDDTTDSTPADKTSRPLWTYTVEDWWNGIQLAYTELQYETINKSNNKNQ